MSGVTTELDDETGAPEPEHESGKMSFLEHLDELRKRLVHVAAYLAIGTVVAWFFHRQIYDFLALPITRLLPPGTKLAYTSPIDVFTLYMKVSLVAGVVLTLPLNLFEVWKFIAPGLYRREKRYAVPFMLSSMILFVAGAAFCYYMVLPAMFGWLLNLGKSFMPVIKIDEYLDTTDMMLLAFGVFFEMPVVAAFLSIFGIVSARFLWNKARYAILILVILAAVISPTGDAVNLAFWSAPLIALYFISVLVAAIFGWRRKAKLSS
ncbi:MAG: twin-arginine translocase subunit TatC [Acidobacteriota bacterium]|jgi:sec-independent protein translocase protein TatC